MKVKTFKILLRAFVSALIFYVAFQVYKEAGVYSSVLACLVMLFAVWKTLVIKLLYKTMKDEANS